jgi:hypothetical protein
MLEHGHQDINKWLDHWLQGLQIGFPFPFFSLGANTRPESSAFN